VLLGELRRWNTPDAAVRSHFVVVASPCRNRRAGLAQRLEPVLVQAFVAEPPVEAFDVAVLHGPSGLDQQMPDAVGLGPGDERPAGELRAVVGTHRCWIAPEGGGLVQQPRDVGSPRFQCNK